MSAVQERRGTVDGVPRHWLERGSGTPVVLVHGIPTSARLWRHVLPLLDGVRALAPDMVGYGESIPAGDGRDVSVSAQADHLLAWLGSLGIDRAVLVGHDLGGGVVTIAAVRRPELVAGLVLTNAIGYDSWPIPSVKALRRAAPVLSRLPAPALLPALTTLTVRGHDSLARAGESLPVHYGAYARHGGGAALARQVQALDVRDTLAVQDALPSLDVPARVVWGAADAFQRVEYGERYARDLRAPLHRVEGGKHFVPEDHPDVLAEHVLAVVAEATGPAAADTPERTTR